MAITSEHVARVAVAGQDHTLSQQEKWANWRKAMGFNGPRMVVTRRQQRIWAQQDARVKAALKKAEQEGRAVPAPK